MPKEFTDSEYLRSIAEGYDDHIPEHKAHCERLREIARKIDTRENDFFHLKAGIRGLKCSIEGIEEAINIQLIAERGINMKDNILDFSRKQKAGITKNGKIVIDSDGKISIEGFHFNKVGLFEGSELAINWAIRVLRDELR